MTTEKLERPGRATPGFCVNHGDPKDESTRIKDAPENGNMGYCALFPARHEDGTPKTFMEQGATATTAREITPAGERTLCRKCYKAELEEKYPGGLDKYSDPINDPFPNG